MAIKLGNAIFFTNNRGTIEGQTPIKMYKISVNTDAP
jgi:hypothetical protein